ncbi:MAG: NAD-dependent epimerase/dehydratase family protein [Pseudomonadota bacterium]
MTILVTGVAGFIGAHAAQALLAAGHEVIGIDNLNAYYAPQLKRDRLERLSGSAGFSFHEVDIASLQDIRAALGSRKPTKILHLAAQAGVRYSLENPSAYADANLNGHFAMLELAREMQVDNMVYASSSSVYGGNTKIPFAETDLTDDPVSFYGATKKSNELMARSYARLHGLSLTGLRFFTVYGPWGRPDMAYWIFAEKILKGDPIEVFNHGKMSRDFTYIDDIVAGILAALDRPARVFDAAVPHRIYNLGNDKPEQLMDLIRFTEAGIGAEAEKIYKPMQRGDLEKTWADIDRARSELDYDPKTGLRDGLELFADWFRTHWTRYC